MTDNVSPIAWAPAPTPGAFIDPRTVYLAIPCADGRMMAETAAALLRIPKGFAAFSFPSEVSHVTLVRNHIADSFLRSGMDWLVSIDSDIYFTPEDWNFLLQPCAPELEGPEQPTPSRVLCTRMLKHSSNSVVGQQIVPPSVCEGVADMLVFSQYSYKNETEGNTDMGFGFVRIHRSVFEQMRELRHIEGPTVEVDRQLVSQLRALLDTPVGNPDGVMNLVEMLCDSVIDHAGSPRLATMNWRGNAVTDFFPSGPLLNGIVPTPVWKGEDHGFFTLAMLAGIIPRRELRTRLLHIGRKAYAYEPNTGSGQ